LFDPVMDSSRASSTPWARRKVRDIDRIWQWLCAHFSEHWMEAGRWTKKYGE
ncbi:hypothetical protein BaRGS_00012417, partial [Batillaria attramentaria]